MSSRGHRGPEVEPVKLETSVGDVVVNVWSLHADVVADAIAIAWKIEATISPEAPP